MSTTPESAYDAWFEDDRGGSQSPELESDVDEVVQDDSFDDYDPM